MSTYLKECPLTKRKCIRDQCALWNGIKCSLALTSELDQLSYDIQELSEKLSSLEMAVKELRKEIGRLGNA